MSAAEITHVPCLARSIGLLHSPGLCLQANRFGKDVENKAEELGDEAQDTAENAKRKGQKWTDHASDKVQPIPYVLLALMCFHVNS